MKKTVYFDDFYSEFKKIRPNNFSDEGLYVLFDYLEECERDIGEEWELDVITLCCDFIEESWQDIAESYDIDLSECKDDEEKYEAVSVYIEGKLEYVGEVSGGFVYRRF